MLKTYMACIYSFIERQESNLPSLKIVTCPNEMVALSCAQGYAQVCGKAAAVIVHVDCGTQVRNSDDQVSQRGLTVGGRLSRVLFTTYPLVGPQYSSTLELHLFRKTTSSLDLGVSPFIDNLGAPTDSRQRRIHPLAAECRGSACDPKTVYATYRGDPIGKEHPASRPPGSAVCEF